ncbi:hypothetical protein LCGC14_3030450, partial [marine sediment metagenome]
LASDSLFTTDLETVSEGQTRAFNKGGFTTVNRYARVRAKFPTSEWTGWTVFGTPTAVASGAVPTSLSELSGDLDDVSDSATRFAAEEANANRTENNTSADTTLVSGTAAATVETGAVRANAGLDSVGDLARDVLIARADSSDLLRRSAGGLYSGNLAATLGATWNTDLGNRPTELTDGRVAAVLAASGELKAVRFNTANFGIKTLANNLLTSSKSSPATGWVAYPLTASIDVPAETVSVTLEMVLPSESAAGSRRIQTGIANIGFSITSGAGPATPQVSRQGNGSLTQSSPVKGAGLTLTLYINFTTGTFLVFGGAEINQDTVLPVAIGKVT